MFRKCLAPLTLLMLHGHPSPASAISRPAEHPIPAPAMTVNADTLTPGMVTFTPDIAYSTLPGYRPMLLDLYRPGGNGRHPLVIFVHGGSWTTGSKRTTGNFADFPGVLGTLAQRGFVVASADYRLSGEAPFPAALQDIKAAIRFLRANAERYGIDPARIAIWGASAGAHLGALAAFTGEDMEFDPPGMEHAGQSDRVQAFVGWYGPYELGGMFRQAMTPGSTVEPDGALRFFGCTRDGCPPGVFAKASPVSYADAGAPPTLLIHGTDDTTVPAEQSRQLNEKLKAAGASSELMLIGGVSHNWTGKDAQTTATASRKALEATFSWLERQLSGSR
ncbi:MAG: alpha/beta hydrolase [Chlorobiaceae bacterium]|nr:alpha/beta hydrolase [Chlorobiaceae bacterium]